VSRSWFAGVHAAKSLLSLMDDCATSVEAVLQWTSDSSPARELDAGLGQLKGDLVADRPLFEYLRYDAALEGSWLEKELSLSFSERDVRTLKKMDRPANLPSLAKIGAKAAAVQVKDEHFPPNCDFG
jgi:hypothetical protein